MGLDVAVARQKIARRLRSLARPGGDPKLQAYLGSPYPVMGLSTAQMRSAQREFRAEHPDLTLQDVHGLAAALWAGETLEEKAFAIGLLSRHAAVLDDRSWSLADSWVDDATGWALSDGLASGPISAMVRAYPKRFAEILRWTKAENYWRRRASTYALNDLVRAGELDKPFQLLERLLYDPEFWVQRAVGTWLRECWKKDARRTEAFLRKHVRGLPRVTITVATERASKGFREELREKRTAATRKKA
jgi:3-methyladenine DNA glycosylase AlkD